MKTVKNLKLVAAALAAAGIVATAVAATTTSSTSTPSTTADTPSAWHHHHHGHMMGGILMQAIHQLNLDDAQKQSIKSILTTARGQFKAQASSNAMDIAVLGNPGDSNYTAAIESAKTRAAQRIQQASDVEMQIYSVLSPQQKSQLPHVLAAMKAKFAARRAAFQAEHSGAATTN